MLAAYFVSHYFMSVLHFVNVVCTCFLGQLSVLVFAGLLEFSYILYVFTFLFNIKQMND